MPVEPDKPLPLGIFNREVSAIGPMDGFPDTAGQMVICDADMEPVSLVREVDDLFQRGSGSFFFDDILYEI